MQPLTQFLNDLSDKRDIFHIEDTMLCRTFRQWFVDSRQDPFSGKSGISPIFHKRLVSTVIIGATNWCDLPFH